MSSNLFQSDPAMSMFFVQYFAKKIAEVGETEGTLPKESHMDNSEMEFVAQTLILFHEQVARFVFIPADSKEQVRIDVRWSDLYDYKGRFVLANREVCEFEIPRFNLAQRRSIFKVRALPPQPELC